ncbi:galactose-specific lectin nattectin-like [Labrus mixtus]|uniref:galactose-specific lectin nattectin-like n=1 Tax=Labrus mixtus TaxID=508554 RepID=UPI0029BFDD8B|nr:galactose-specific lectin nattectin-like [Labrus mixtus]
MALTFLLVVLIGLSSGLLMGADAKCPRNGDCCKGCPEGWVEIAGQCYMFNNKRMDWCDAEAHCISEGGNLAAILEADHAQQFREMVVKAAGKEIPVWIGGYDAVKEGKWKWSNGKKCVFSGWGPKEPSNSKDRNCMAIGDKNSQPIEDDKCDVKKAFLCARELAHRD